MKINSDIMNLLIHYISKSKGNFCFIALWGSSANEALLCGMYSWINLSCPIKVSEAIK